MRAIQILIVSLVATFGSAVSAAPMTFEFGCAGNATEACYIFAVGDIGRDTDKEFAAFLEKESIEGNQMHLA